MFSKCDIDVNLVMQLLVHSQSLAVDIAASETNILCLVRTKKKKKQQATDLQLLCNEQAEANHNLQLVMLPDVLEG